MGKTLNFGKNAGLFLCVCALFFALAFSFSHTKIWLVKSRANTATVTDKQYRITVQSAKLPFPVGLMQGHALSFSTGVFNVEELLAFFGAKLIASESVEGVTLYHAYAKGLGKSESLPFGKVNLQIAVGKDYIALATPVFYGSF
ncbi:MAG: hypothetical protein E7363_04505 [Clostridiales bacterium]|nr:hypothetical protein [Clostridiales bacterium]